MSAVNEREAPDLFAIDGRRDPRAPPLTPASTSWRRRSAISATSRSARSPRSPRPTSSPARTRASPRVLLRPLRHRDAAHRLSRAQCRRGSGRSCSPRSPKARRWRWSATPARRSSPIPAIAWSRRRARRAMPVIPIPGAFGGARGAGRRRPADRRVPLRRLPAAEGGGAAEAPRRARRRCRRRSSSTNRRSGSPRRSPTWRDVFGGERPAAVARELTKTFETVRRGTLGALAAHYAGEDAPKGEIVIVVGPPRRRSAAGGGRYRRAASRRSSRRKSVSAAASEAAALTGLAAARTLPARARPEGRRRWRRAE